MSLTHELLSAHGIAHGFGERGEPAPPALRRPHQVHGVRVVSGDACRADPPPDADAVLSLQPGERVGVVTADCVPILVGARDRRAVVAIHAGWRGLAAGVIETGVDAVRRSAPDADWVAAIGPHIGPCHYEVDAPVVDSLGLRFPAALGDATAASRPGHWWLDLGALALAALQASGIEATAVGRLSRACTACDARRFESYRRDGERSGRLVHWIAVGEA